MALARRGQVPDLRHFAEQLEPGASADERLCLDLACSLRVRVVRIEKRIATLLLIKFLIVEGALLGIDQRVIGERQHGEFPRRLL